MAEEKAAGMKSAVSGWVKAGVTSIVGVLSGAFIMYLTPVVNSAIKPAKPVANFATQVTGLTVQFSNRSTGAVQGWWDFGDGSALEPFDPKVESVQHAYAKPGSYNAKLELTNLIGDESDRSVTIVIDAQTPEIESFQLIPLTPGERAPAVYQLVSKVKNANFAVLSFGDNRSMEVLDASSNQVRYVTFDEMGSYTVRLAAINGKQLVEKTKTIFISPNEGLEPMAKLLVAYEAVEVSRHEQTWSIPCSWPANAKESVAAFRKEQRATPKFTIVSADLLNKDKAEGVRNLQVEISADKKKAFVTGEFVRPTGLLASNETPPTFAAQLHLKMERRSAPQTINRGDVSMAVNLNSTIKIPMQPLEDGYEIIAKKVSLELWDGTRKVWAGSKAVTNAKVTLKNQACLVTATPQKDGFLLKIDAPTVGKGPPPPVIPASSQSPAAPLGPVIRPASFERNPLRPTRSKS